jgi:hypothetical protein
MSHTFFAFGGDASKADNDILNMFRPPANAAADDTNNNNNNNYRNEKTRTVIQFDALKHTFDADPAAALLNSIPLTHNPERLVQNNEAQIESIQARMKAEDKIKDTLHKNPVYRFSKLLQSFVGPQMHSKIANFNLDEIGDNPALIQVILGERRVEQPAISPSEQLASSTASGSGSGSASKRRISSIFNTDVDQAPYETKASQLKYLEQMMHTSMVSGRAILSDLTMGKITEALATMRAVDFKEYNRKTYEHFMKDDQVMALFAQLVSLFFNIGMYKHSPRYVANAVLPRERRDITLKAKTLHMESIYDARIGGYRPRTSQENMEIQAAYTNPANFRY